MTGTFISADELVRASKADFEVRQDDSFFVGIIKPPNDKADSIQVSQIGIGEWIEVPTKMIASAKLVGIATSDGTRYQVALIKLNEPSDPFAKVAYRLLSQLGAIQRPVDGKKGDECGCTHASGQDTATAASIGRISLGGGLGQFGGSLTLGCHFEFRCYDCTRCIPWTDICWSSTCCDLVSVDCDISI
jgi:hypothetical protein